ncbi:MAG: DEAD/DEAH box helicase [Candidatus Pacebacteria bacterium]|nr:DEAD/DEAH box helicase [Candidatus Paceibacterota bacterium]
MSKNISIDIQDSYYILSGDVEAILQNKRILLSIKRLHFMQEGKIIKIPFEIKTKIFVLQEIQELLLKFDFIENICESVKKEVSAYNNEQKNFKFFSEKAEAIRNDKFSKKSELVDSFRYFKEVLEQSMVRTLYPLQMLSAYHMAFSQNACNFAVPGAGKTSIVYGAYIYLKNLPKDDPKHIDKILVIGPLSSFAPWENEYEECFDKKVRSQRLSGDASTTRDEKEEHLYSTNPKELTLISHAGIRNLEQEIIDFLKQNKTMVVVDEAHRIKNADGIWGRSAVEIAKEATSRVILTGTPVPNGYEDLYNLFRFIYPFKFQDILQIHYEQLKELTKNSVSVKDKRVRVFIENIKPYFIRIKKKDLKLPDVQENIVSIVMDDNQREIYDFIEERYVKSFQSNPSATVKDVLNKAKLIRLRQAATNPSLLLKTLQDSLEDSVYGIDPNIDFATVNNESIDDSEVFRKIINYNKISIPQKFLKIENLLENEIFPRNEKAIIWTIFIQNAEELQKYLEKNKIKTKLLIGRVPQIERESIIENFNNPENSDFNVVIANPFSVSESISLHKGCHNAIYMERDYNAANFLQSKDRIHRVGLLDNVVTNYFYLVSDDSIDSVINQRLDLKVKRMEEIIDEDIPLFKRINDSDETDIITTLLKDYARRT